MQSNDISLCVVFPGGGTRCSPARLATAAPKPAHWGAVRSTFHCMVPDEEGWRDSDRVCQAHGRVLIDAGNAKALLQRPAAYSPTPTESFLVGPDTSKVHCTSVGPSEW